MKRLIIFLLVVGAALSSHSQNSWVVWNNELFYKTGTDSVSFGDHNFATAVIRLKDSVNTRVRTNQGNQITGITKDQVGLGNVNNTSDADKPISSATQTSLNAKQATLVSGTNIKTINGTTVLGTGDLIVGGAAVWGGITGVLTAQLDLQSALDGKLATNGNGSSLTGLTKSQVGLANVDNTSDANKPVSTATQTALDAKQNTISLTTTGTSGAATLVGSTLNIPNYAAGGGDGFTRVFLPSNVINNNAVANTMQDVTDLSFPVVANTTYQFRFVIVYDAAATATGSRWSINGPATTYMSYKSQYPTSATASTWNTSLAGYNLPAASNASSAVTSGNRCEIEGEIRPSANGTVIARFASEITASAITAIASGRSYVEYKIIN